MNSARTKTLLFNDSGTGIEGILHV